MKFLLGSLTTACLLVLQLKAQGKDTITFTDGLAVGAGNRSNIYTDPVYYQWVTQNKILPIESDSIGVSRQGDLERWEKISIDEKGVINSEKLRRGYLYITYDALEPESKVITKNNSPENIYIQSIKVNGKELDRFWLTHEEITNSGTLELEMGSEAKI